MKSQGLLSMKGGCEDMDRTIVHYLNVRDLGNVAAVSRDVRALATCDDVWQNLCKLRFKNGGGNSMADFEMRYKEQVQVVEQECTRLVNQVSRVYVMLLAGYAVLTTLVIVPVLAIAKLDGYVDMEWNTVLMMFFGLYATPFIFIVLRVVMMAAMHKGISEDQDHLVYTIPMSKLVKITLVNADTVKFFKSIVEMVLFLNVLPQLIGLYLNGQLRNVSYVIIPAWIYVSMIAIKLNSMTKKNVFIGVLFSIASGLYCVHHDAPQYNLPMHMCFMPLLPILCFGFGSVLCSLKNAWQKYPHETSILNKLYEIVYADITWQHPPYLAFILLCLKVNDTSDLSYAVLSADYWGWLCLGPIATKFLDLLSPKTFP